MSKTGCLENFTGGPWTRRAGLATIGFCSAVAQVMLMREMVATFYGNELLFGLVLVSWLAWVAAGAWGLFGLLFRDAGKRGLDQSGATFFALGQIGLAALLPLQMAVVRGVRLVLNVTPGALVEFGPMLLAVVLIPAPFCLLAGYLFVLGARLGIDLGGTGGQAYLWESLGAVAGGVLLSFLFLPLLDPFQIALLPLVICLSLVAWTLLPRPRASIVGATSVTIVGLAAALLLGPALNTLTLAWQWSDVVYAGDSPYGRLVVEARDGQRIFFQNGLLAFDTQTTFPEEVVHFPLLAHPSPRSLLLIGGGVAGDVREALKHPLEDVTYVELDPLLIETALTQLPAADAAPLLDSRVSLVLADGRHYVRTAKRTYDVVILDLPPPSTGALNRFYTFEFFRQVAGLLNPGGLFALGVPSAENYWSPELARRNASLYDTLRSVFPNTLALVSGTQQFFLASQDPIEASPTVLTSRLVSRNVDTLQVTPAYIDYVLTDDRFYQEQQAIQAAGEVKLNRDLVPICYYYELVLWLSHFYPGMRAAFERLNVINLLWALAPLGLLAGLTRWRRSWAIPVCLAGIGLAQMTLEVVILLGFQMLHGTVYARLSLMMAAFMGGLALGAAAGNRLLVGWRLGRQHRAWMALFGLQLSVVICCLVVWGVLATPTPAPAFVFVVLALVTGCLPGMAFPLAVTLVGDDGASGVGRLYAFDLLGACLGAGLSAVFLVPVLGIPQTCILVALVGLAGLLVLI